MKNSDFLYVSAKQYQDSRKDIEDSYLKRMKVLESAKGSRYFTIEADKATRTREEGLKKIKADFMKAAKAALKSMFETSNSRTFEAPTPEETAILNALKMRETVREGEIMKAANAIKSPLALEVLREIAKKNGFVQHIDGDADNEMSVRETQELIKSLSSSIEDFIDFDTSRAARKAREHKANFYGLTSEEAATPIKKRPLFNTKAAFYDEITPYLTSERREAFFQATDGE